MRGATARCAASEASPLSTLTDNLAEGAGPARSGERDVKGLMATSLS
jgi:hypothetical protein